MRFHNCTAQTSRRKPPRVSLSRTANRLRDLVGVLLFCLGMLLGSFDASALTDNAQLVSVSLQSNTLVMPRTTFLQTWTIQNTGTSTWSPGISGYTLNLVGTDTLAAVPFSSNINSSWRVASATIGSGKSIAPGGQATFTMSFIAPEAAGTNTDTFQMYSASGVAFGPLVTMQAVIKLAGSTNQFDRAKAVMYANKYANYVCSDGYFFTNSSDQPYLGPGAPVPTAELGDDCAHFVSCCIGCQPNEWGGGLKVYSRDPPGYGEPGAANIVNKIIIGAGFGAEVSSLSQMSPGDVVAWNWEGNTNISSIDHVTLYLGNGLLASHSESGLDVPANTWFQDGEPNWKWHLIHIYDAPTLTTTLSGASLVLSWGTNWTGYNLYSSTSLVAKATWTKITTPKASGTLYKVTNAIPKQGMLFYHLMLP